MVRIRTASESELDDVQRLAAIIHGIRIAMLTTVDADGTLHGRPMATQQVPFDGRLWFFTGNGTHKVEEIRARPWVNVTYASSHAYVSVSGQAEALIDGRKMRDPWSPSYEAWFPQGLDDPALLLLRIQVEQADWWSVPGGAVTRAADFVKSLASGKRVEAEEHRHLDLPISHQG